MITRYQTIISSEAITPPAGYKCYEQSKLQIYFDAAFRAVTFNDNDGNTAGIIIGFPFDCKHETFIKDDAVLENFAAFSHDTIEHDLLPNLAGSFMVITFGTLSSRIYPDHGGSLPFVYCPEMRIGGSSTSLFLDEGVYNAKFDKELYNSLVLKEGSGGWISGTLTAHAGIYRLLPNHFLDLDQWQAHRFWPAPFDIDDELSAESQIPAINDAMAAFTKAAFNEFRTSATLTAGFDARMILASCRNHLADSSFFTIAAPGGKVDIEVSSLIARNFDLDHEVIGLVKSTEEQKELWDFTVGHCVHEQNRETYQTLLRLTNHEFIMTGMYGEVGRCRLYRNDFHKINQMQIDENFVISRLTLPQHPRLQENIRHWLDELAGRPNSAIMDLAFHELKFGSWGMGQRPIQNSCKYALHPFSQRAILDPFVRLSPLEKTTTRLFANCIEKAWPELASIPINKYGDYRDKFALFEKLMNPSRVRRYLRDTFAKVS